MGLLEWIALSCALAGLVAWLYGIDQSRMRLLSTQRESLLVVTSRLDAEVSRCDGLEERIAGLELSSALREQEAATLRREIDHLARQVEAIESRNHPRRT